MKRKNGTLYTIGIMFLVLALLTWFLPITTYQTDFSEQGYLKVGLMELFAYPTYTFYNFIYIFIFLLLVGGLYAILKKIKAYRLFVDKVVSIVKEREIFYTILTVLLLSITVSFTGLTFEMLAIMPFIATIVLLSGKDKITAALLTVGSMTVGVIGNTFSSNIAGLFVSSLQLDFNDLIISKIILLILGCVTLIFTILLHNRKNKDEELDQEFYFIPEKVEDKEKEKVWPLVTILSIFVFIKVLASISWRDIFAVSLFADIKEKVDSYPLFSKLVMFIIFGLLIIIMLSKYIINKKKDSNTTLRNTLGKVGFIVFIISVAILSLVTIKVFFEDLFKVTTIFTKVYNAIGLNTVTISNLVGEVSAIGEWSYSEYIVWIMVLCLILTWKYKIKLSDTIDNIGNGMKNVLYAAIVCMFAYTILVLTSNNPVILSILKPIINLTKSTTIAPVIRIFLYMFSALVSSFMNSDFSYFNYGVFNLTFATNNFGNTPTMLSITSLLHQGAMGLAILIAPTSIPMLFTLNTLNLSYKKWLKKTWLLFAILLYLVLIISIIDLLLY